MRICWLTPRHRMVIGLTLAAILLVSCSLGVAGRPPSPTRPRTSVPIVIPVVTTPPPTASLPLTDTSTAAPPTASAVPRAAATAVPPPATAPLPPAATNPPTLSPTPESYPPLTGTWSMIDAGPGPDNIAIMTIHVNVTGGDGNYTYYWNRAPVDGPIFEIRVPQQATFTGTISVRSGDGQELVFPTLYEWIAWYATPIGGAEKGCHPWYPGITRDEINC